MKEQTAYYDNYNGYFRYQGNTYASKTKVKLTQDYVDTHTYNGEKIWPYAYFEQRSIRDNKIQCLFFKYNLGRYGKGSECCGYFFIAEDDLEYAIEEVIYPVAINIIPREKKKDWDVPEVMVMWGIYIVALLFSFIFTEWYIIWLWGTILFFLWRNRKLWE